MVSESEFRLPNIAATRHDAATTISKNFLSFFCSFERTGDNIINSFLSSRLELKKRVVKEN